MSSSKELRDPTRVQAQQGEFGQQENSAQPAWDQDGHGGKKSSEGDRSSTGTRKLKPFSINRHERLLVLGTMLAVLVAGSVLGLLYADERTNELFAMVPSSFLALGKFLPLVWPVMYKTGFGPYELGAVIWTMDTTTAILFVYSLELLYKIGIVARGLTRVQRNARLVLRAYPSIRKFTILGIMLFVLFPVSGTGAIGGAFLGALLGMHRLTLIITISMGGLLGGMSMAYAAVNAKDFAKQLQDNQGNPIILVLLVSVVAIAIYGMSRAYKKALAKAERDEAADQRGKEV